MNAQSFQSFPAGGSGSHRLCSDQNAAAVTEALDRRGWTFLKVSGRSMFPWIRPRDIVFLRRANACDVARGDVVVFEKNGALCIHRVLSAARGAAQGDIRLLTKGDAVADADEPVSAQEFRGKVEFVYRRNRELSIAAGWRRYLGRLLALISPATRWWRPVVSAPDSPAPRGESRNVPQIGARHSAEHSAD